jgi:hypothetical protein
MSKPHMNRLKRMEQRVHRQPVTRTIYACTSEYDAELEGHDSLRAKLHIKPEIGVEDLVVYCLKRGAPPRLKVPDAWQHSIYKPAEETAIESGAEAAAPVEAV